MTSRLAQATLLVATVAVAGVEHQRLGDLFQECRSRTWMQIAVT